jgi:hypothetical protein
MPIACRYVQGQPHLYTVCTNILLRAEYSCGRNRHSRRGRENHFRPLLYANPIPSLSFVTFLSIYFKFRSNTSFESDYHCMSSSNSTQTYFMLSFTLPARNCFLCDSLRFSSLFVVVHLTALRFWPSPHGRHQPGPHRLRT